MLGLDNPIHLLFVGVLLLLVFGAKRLPELGQSLGSGLRGFKESLGGDSPASSISEHTGHDTTDAPAATAAASLADKPHLTAPAPPVA